MKQGVRKKIIIVDDEPDMLNMLEVRLTSNGYEVAKALNGKTGVELIKTEHPDLVLLDIMMSDLSGGEVARTLRADDKTKDIPIIFLSGALNKRDKKEIEIDGHWYAAVAKPFYHHELMSIIRKLLRKK